MEKTRYINAPANPQPKPRVVEEKTGEDVYALWQDRIKSALRWRQAHWNGDTAWKRAYRMFRGDHWRQAQSLEDADSEVPRDRITVNATGSTILGFMPFLVRKNRKFITKARRPKWLTSAALQKAILNFEWQRRKMGRQLKRAVLDSAIIGHGVVKTGFVLEVNEEAARKKAQDGRITYEDYVQKQHPYIKRVSPLLFVFDPEAPEHDLDSARWCGEIFFKSMQDVLANKNYNQKVLAAVRSGLFSPDTVSSYLSQSLAKDQGVFTKQEEQSIDTSRIVLFEIWDKKHQKYYIFLSGVEDPVVERDWPYPYLQSFPYHIIPFIELPDEHYPVGIPRWIEDQQFELNRIRTSMFEHRRRFNRKYVAVEGQVDPVEMDKLEAGEDGTVVIVKSLEAVRALEETTLQSDNIQTEAVIKQDIREITGADELLRGGSLPSRTSATEVQARSNLIGLKLDERVGAVDEKTVDIATQIVQHIQENMEVEEVVEIAGPQGRKYWVTYSRDDIAGETMIDLETVSDQDPVTEKQQAIQVLQIVIQNYAIISQAGVQINMGELFRYVFDTMEVPEIARIFPLTSVPPEPVSDEEGAGGPGNEVGTEVNAGDLLPGQLAGAPGQINAGELGKILGNLGGGAQTGV